MQARLRRNLAKLNEQTQHLFAELQHWSPERLRFRAELESWSVLDILDHLVLTERAVLAVMRQNLNAGNVINLRDRLRNLFVNGIMMLPTRLQVPTSVTFLLPSRTRVDLCGLRSEWDADRKALSTFLEGLSSADRRKGVFRHPVGGWTTPNGGLVFLRLHLHHHRYQFARIRKASKALDR